MSNIKDNTSEVKVLTYTQRLIMEFTDSAQSKFTAVEVEKIIKDFAKTESDKKKHISDVLPFGKYKYKTVNDVLSFDQKYCQWLVKQDMLENYQIGRAHV